MNAKTYTVENCIEFFLKPKQTSIQFSTVHEFALDTSERDRTCIRYKLRNLIDELPPFIIILPSATISLETQSVTYVRPHLCGQPCTIPASQTPKIWNYFPYIKFVLRSTEILFCHKNKKSPIPGMTIIISITVMQLGR